MMYIAHRGNLEGRKAEHENDPGYLQEAIDERYVVEIDLWKVGDRIYLGHDEGQHDITLDWLHDRKPSLLCHAKNREALDLILRQKLHGFWHTSEDYVQTTWHYTVGYPGKPPVGPLFILGVPERVWDIEGIKEQMKDGVFGVMSDYVKLLNT